MLTSIEHKEKYWNNRFYVLRREPVLPLQFFCFVWTCWVQRKINRRTCPSPMRPMELLAELFSLLFVSVCEGCAVAPCILCAQRIKVADHFDTMSNIEVHYFNRTFQIRWLDFSTFHSQTDWIENDNITSSHCTKCSRKPIQKSPPSKLNRRQHNTILSVN